MYFVRSRKFLTPLTKSSQRNAYDILIRGCASTEMHQEHQVRHDINGSYASIEPSRDCEPALLAGKPTFYY